MNLEQKRNKFCLVIGADYFDNKLLSCIDEIGCQYAYILHDKDFNDLGEKKNNHFHIVVTYKERKRAKQVLNKFATILDCDNVNIQIDECHNFIASIQYLIHKNNPNKYQYDINDIVTNFTFEMLESFINSNIESRLEMSFSSLLDVVTSSSGKIDIIKKIGIGNYQCYRYTINDIIDELNRRRQHDHDA